VTALERLAPAALLDPALARLVPGRPPLGLAFLSGVLAFLAVLALGLAVGAGRAAERWAGEVSAAGTLSIIAEEAELEAQARAALDILAETPGVRQVRVMEPAEQRALLAPWLGTGIAVDGVDLPLMIEVETDRRLLDAAALDARLAAEAPGAVFDDHTAWRLPLVAAAERQRGVGLAAVALLVAAAAAAAALAAQAGAAEAGRSLGVLKAIGFADAPLAGVVGLRAAAAAMVGAAPGALLGTLLVGGLGPEAPAAVVGAGFAGWSWGAPALLLLALAAASWAAAIVAARRAVRAWP
jgi:cell division transport system permease protein